MALAIKRIFFIYTFILIFYISNTSGINGEELSHIRLKQLDYAYFTLILSPLFIVDNIKEKVIFFIINLLIFLISGII